MNRAQKSKAVANAFNELNVNSRIDPSPLLVLLLLNTRRDADFSRTRDR